MKYIDGIVLFMVKVYRKYISPYKRPCCRFYPTCSKYMYDAVGKYGAVKGVYLGVKRIFRCHPFHPGGYDPVP